MAVTNHGNGFYELDAEGDVLTGVFYIEHIEWLTKGAAPGNDFLLTDIDGNTIQEAVSDVNNYHAHEEVRAIYTNPTLTTLDSGKCFIKTKLHPNNI